MVDAWPLSGVRVVDLSTEIAGPYCTKMLVDAGAEVIKVEPAAGDPLRRWSASHRPMADGEDGALFQYLNASKRSVVADLETEAGRDLVLDLAAAADIVIETFGAGEMERLGLSLAALGARNRAVSLVSISPWGQTGPWARRPATEWTLQAATGSTAGRGLPERGPVAFGGRIGEWIAGTYAALGAVCAWLYARETGTGQHIDLSMFEAMLTAMPSFGDFHGQMIAVPLMQRIELPGIEPAKDGWVGFCTNTFEQWNNFCGFIGHPELGEDRGFTDFAYRMERVDLLRQVFHTYTRQHTVDEIVETATAWRIPCSPVGNGHYLMPNPQLEHREFFQLLEHPYLGTKRYPGLPMRFSAMTPRHRSPPPTLGQHNDEILAGELGLSPEEIAALRRKQVIGERPSSM